MALWQVVSAPNKGVEFGAEQWKQPEPILVAAPRSAFTGRPGLPREIDEAKQEPVFFPAVLLGDFNLPQSLPLREIFLPPLSIFVPPLLLLGGSPTGHGYGSPGEEDGASRE